MILNAWAADWNIPPEALQDLRQCLGATPTDPSPQAGESEAAVQTRIRLEASRGGARLWRNNVGVLQDLRGVPVRYGLANDSKQLNARVKSSDLIGLRPVTIRPEHVGAVLGQFVAREVKAGSWRYTGTARELAQLRFLELVLSLGGDAAFANREGTL